MKASTIKHILPQVIPKLEYKHYPLALVLDTINGLANTSQHSDTAIVSFVDRAIRYVQNNNQVHIMAMSTKQRYNFWKTVMELVKWIAQNYSSLDNHTGEQFGVVAPRWSFFSAQPHPVAWALGYTSPANIGAFVNNFYLEDITLTVRDPETGLDHEFSIKFNTYSLVCDYSVDSDPTEIFMRTKNLLSGEFTNVLAHIIGGIRFLGLVDKNGVRHFSDTYRINGLRYFVRTA